MERRATLSSAKREIERIGTRIKNCPPQRVAQFETGDELPP
jgi:hypothetical protein